MSIAAVARIETGFMGEVYPKFCEGLSGQRR